MPRRDTTASTQTAGGDRLVACDGERPTQPVRGCYRVQAVVLAYSAFARPRAIRVVAKGALGDACIDASG
jgi:hypothetical protein